MNWLITPCVLVALAIGGAGCRDRQDPVSENPPKAGPRPGAADTPATATLEARIEAAMQRGPAYLVAHQGADGAFRSEHYAAFKDGYSLSPLALLALGNSSTPDAPGRTRSMTVAMQDLKLERLWVIYPGNQEYQLDDGIFVIPMSSIPNLIRKIGKGR